jgi:ketosteroid isomerase-like protein
MAVRTTSDRSSESVVHPIVSPAVALVTRFYQAYAIEDLEGMRAVLAQDIVWRIPGRNSISGDHHGIEETMYFFTQLTKAQFKADVHALVGNDEYAIDSHRGWGSYGGSSLDIEWVIVWRVRDGKIIEGTDFAFDQEAADIFYSAVYPLKPLSQRLA